MAATILVVAPEKELSKCEDEFAAVKQLMPLKLLTATKAVHAVSTLQRAGGSVTAVFLHARFSAPGKEDYSETLRKFLKQSCPDLPVIAFGASKGSCGTEGEHYHYYMGAQVDPGVVAKFISQALQAGGVTAVRPAGGASRVNSIRRSLDSSPCSPKELSDSPRHSMQLSSPRQPSSLSLSPRPARLDVPGSPRSPAAAQRRSLQLDIGNNSFNQRSSMEACPITPTSPAARRSMDVRRSMNLASSNMAAATAPTPSTFSMGPTALCFSTPTLGNSDGRLVGSYDSNTGPFANYDSSSGSGYGGGAGVTCCGSMPGVISSCGTTYNQQGFVDAHAYQLGAGSITVPPVYGGSSWFTSLAAFGGMASGEESVAAAPGSANSTPESCMVSSFSHGLPPPVSTTPSVQATQVPPMYLSSALYGGSAGGGIDGLAGKPSADLNSADCACVVSSSSAAAEVVPSETVGAAAADANASGSVDLLRVLAHEVLRLREAVEQKRAKQAAAAAAAVFPPHLLAAGPSGQ